jgi:multiple sugar transport system permease protein
MANIGESVSSITTKVTPTGQASSKLVRRRLLSGWLFLSPALLLLAAVVLYPLLRGIWISFTHYNLQQRESLGQFFGLGQYQLLFDDWITRLAIKNTVVFGFTSIFFAFTIGFALALLLNQNIAFRGLFRGLLLLPYVIPSVVTAFLWAWLFETQFGVLNYLLVRLGLVASNINWVASPQRAMVTVITAYTWRLAPFFMVMLLAGLQTVPQDQKEAALIDGANRLQAFFYVTLPYLRNIIGTVVTLGLIWSFHQYTIIFTMTQGGPARATTTLALHVYKKAFEHFDIGAAAATGVIWLLMLMVLAVISSRFREEEMWL